MFLYENREKRLDYYFIISLHLLNHLLMYMLPILLLNLRDDLDLNYSQSGLIWSLLSITITILSVVSGHIADSIRQSRYWLMFIGTVIMASAWLLISSAHSFTQLIWIFIWFGFGASFFHPPAMSVITEMYESHKGQALSYNISVGMIGTAFSPLLFAGIMILSGSWQRASQLIFIMGIFTLVILLVIHYLRGTFQRYEWREYVVVKQSAKMNYAFVLAPAIFIPLLFSSIRASFFKTSSLFTAMLYEDFLHLSKIHASIATAIIMGIASLFTVLGGRLADTKSEIYAVLISALGTFVGAVGLVILNNFSDLVIFSAFYFILNAFYYIGSPAVSALLANRVKPEHRGKLFGITSSLGQILAFATPFIFGWIKDTNGILAAFEFILVLAGFALLVGVYIYWDGRSKSNQ